MKDWLLFLDDVRDPIAWDMVVRVARTVPDAQELIRQYGLPTVLSLDHDLGDNQQTGYDFVKWLVDEDMNGNLRILNISKFYVHSANPVGSKNMLQYWHNYIKFLQKH